MDISRLVDHFISNSPEFYSDLKVAEIDKKHDQILKAAYESFEIGKIKSIRELRSWDKQSDLHVPLQLSLRYFRFYGVGSGLLRYLYRNILHFKDEKLQRQQLIDDIRIIQSVGGSKFLKENPVGITPGATQVFRYKDLSINPRWLRYIYLLNTIMFRKLLPDNGVWVDIGSYYGGLQGLVKKYVPNTRIVMVDFHHQLCRSYVYLNTMYPNAQHILPGLVRKGVDLYSYPPGSFIYVPVPSFDYISEQNADLVSNFFSLGEMRRGFFETYFKSKIFEEAKFVYLVNRFVSSPFFEKTYDTDLNVFDYVSGKRHLEYFDVFPIHHYNLIRRKVLGSLRHRNISSSYFEMVSSGTIYD